MTDASDHQNLPTRRTAIAPIAVGRAQRYDFSDLEGLDRAFNAWIKRETDAWAETTQPDTALPNPSGTMSENAGADPVAERREMLRTGLGKPMASFSLWQSGAFPSSRLEVEATLEEAETNFDWFMIKECLKWMETAYHYDLRDQFGLGEKSYTNDVIDNHYATFVKLVKADGTWDKVTEAHAKRYEKDEDLGYMSPAVDCIELKAGPGFPNYAKVEECVKLIKQMGLLDKGPSTAAKILVRENFRAAIAPQIEEAKQALGKDFDRNIERLQKLQEDMGDAVSPDLRKVFFGMIEANRMLQSIVINRLEIATSPPAKSSTIEI